MKNFNSLGYYETAYEQIFNSIEHPNFRIWKIIDEDSKCYQNKRKITNSKKLLKFIKIAKNPQALYVSTSTFLKPESNHGFFANQKYEQDGQYHYPREGYLTADCIILDSLFFIDLDSEHDLRIAQEDARKIISAMNKEDCTLDRIQFSGKKGIHLIYHMNPKSYIKNPSERIRHLKMEKRKITNKLLNLDLKTIDEIHAKIIEDPFRVFAAPFSIKNNGQIVRPISREDLMNKDIYDILARDPKGNDAQVANNNIEGMDRASPRTYPQFYNCIANFVPGLKNNYVPFIRMHNQDFKKLNLNKISEELGDMIIFEETDYNWIISLKLFQKDRLLKIMKRLKAVNKGEFRRRYAKFRYTESVDEKGNQILPPPIIIDWIRSNKSYDISQSHQSFFHKFINIRARQLCGKETLKTYIAKVTA